MDMLKILSICCWIAGSWSQCAAVQASGSVIAVLHLYAYQSYRTMSPTA